MTELEFLIPAVNAQIFYVTAELAMPTETPTNKANAEVETLPLKAEMQIRKFKDLHTFSCFFAHQIIMFYFF